MQHASSQYFGLWLLLTLGWTLSVVCFSLFVLAHSLGVDLEVAAEEYVTRFPLVAPMETTLPAVVLIFKFNFFHSILQTTMAFVMLCTVLVTGIRSNEAVRPYV